MLRFSKGCCSENFHPISTSFSESVVVGGGRGDTDYYFKFAGDLLKFTQIRHTNDKNIAIIHKTTLLVSSVQVKQMAKVPKPLVKY